MRNAAAGVLIATGTLVALFGSPDHGINGWTVLGVLIALAGIATARD